MKTLLAAVSISLICFSCNPAKRLQQLQQVVDGYNKNHPLRIDTATKFFPGIDSSKYFQKIADSLLKIYSSKKTDYKEIYRDTCTSASDKYNEGFEFGFIVGSNSCHAKPVHDTVQITITNNDEIDRLNRINNQLTAEKNTATINGAKGEKWLWISISLMILCLGLLIALLIKIFK